MNTLPRKLKLIKDFNFKLPISKEEFLEHLSNNTEVGSLGFFAMSFEVFSGGDKEYKGYVRDDGFKFRRKRKLFDINMNFATVEGDCFYNGRELEVTGIINGFNPIFYPYYIFLAVFYTIFIVVGIFAGGAGNFSFLFIPFILIHALFMGGIPYLLMRGSVNRMAREIEREFYFFTKNS